MLAEVKRWGNSYAIRLTKRDLDRIGVQEGGKVRLEIVPLPDEIDLSGLPTFHDDATDVSENHDRYLYG